MNRAPAADGILDRFPGQGWRWGDRWLSLGGRQLHFVEFEREAATLPRRTAVLLHGMTSHADSWRLVISCLTAVDRIIAPDFRGHGLSDWTREGYWLRDYAADVIELAAAVGATEFDLAGHSLGARVAMVLAGLIPDRIRSLVLSDTGPEVSRSGALKAREIGNTTQAARGYRDAERLRAALWEQHPDWDPNAIEIRITRLYRRNWAGMLVHRGDDDVMWLLGRPGLAEVEAMWTGLRAIQTPALIVRGRQSYLLDDELAERMRQALAKPEYVELDAGHEMLYIQPRELFGPALETFLSSV